MGQERQRAALGMAWLLDTTNRMVGCRTVDTLLDLAYDAIRTGLGYDRVGLLLVHSAQGALVEHIGTDAHGQKFYPPDRVTPLGDGGYFARLLADPRMQADGPGFIYMEDASRDTSPEALDRLDGRPGPSLRVALRSAEAVVGYIAVDNLTSGRPVTPEDAPPLVAFANALASALENVAFLESRERHITTLNADLRQRVEQLTWLQEAAAALASASGLDAVLETIYACVRQGLGYDRVGIFMVTRREDGMLVETEARGTDDMGRPLGAQQPQPPVDDTTISVESPDLHHFLQGHACYYCPDRWAITPPHLRQPLDGRMREHLSVALRDDVALIGYLSVDNLISGRPITERDAPPLVAFAAQAALAVNRARLWAAHEAQGAQLARRVAELEWLREVSRQVNAARSLDAVLDALYDGIRTGLGYDRVGIDLLDPEAGAFIEFLGTDAAGQKTRMTEQRISPGLQSPIWMLPNVAALAAGAEFYYTADAYAMYPAEMRYVLDGTPQQLLQVGLRSDDRVTGIISVDNLVTGRPITAEDAGPLRALAHQVGTAIENARLHERERIEHARVEQTALTDHLTGLGNHRAFHEDFYREASRARRHGEPLALALIDVDEFKEVNDTQGHSQGDRVLTALGRVLRGSRAEDRAFRIGGDEFALLLPATTEDEAVRVVENLRREAQRLLGGATLSIGVTGMLTAETDLDNRREEADAALYEAKRRGRNMVVTFTELRESSILTAPAKVEALRRLLAEGRMDVVFQPIWDLARGALLGVEALSRPAEVYGLSGPREAFELAARIGRAHDLDTLCRQTVLSLAASLPPETLLFLNVAPATLEHTALTGAALTRDVEVVGLSPQHVVLEVTELAAGRSAAVVREALRLRGLGFRLAVDAAGGTPTSQELLSHMPADFVKINRALVARAISDISARATLAALLAHATRANTYVIAEGIETAEMLEFVRGSGRPAGAAQEAIGGVQGDLLGRPNATIPRTPPPALSTGALSSTDPGAPSSGPAGWPTN